MTKVFSNKVKLLEVLNAINEEVYVLIKKSDVFPDYYPYSDLDILCLDQQKVAEKILALLNKYVEKGFKVVATNYEKKKQIHIDIYENETAVDLDVRFDIIAKLPDYNKIDLKDALLYSILDQRQSQNIEGTTVYLLSKVDDLIIRYAEYIENYELRPDKVKHLEYIVSTLNEDPDARKFLDKLHMYTELKLLEEPRDSYLGRHSYLTLKDGITNLTTALDHTNAYIERSNSDLKQFVLDRSREVLAELESTKQNTDKLLHSDIVKAGRLLGKPKRILSKLRGK